MDGTPPTSFVSRDRARRFALRIGRIAQERSLAWRGAAVGMAVLHEDPATAVAAALEDVETSVRDVLEGRLRDRERSAHDRPFVVAAEGLAARLRLAQAILAASPPGRPPPEEAREAVLGLLRACLQRIDAFCAAYDERRPAGPPRPVDVLRLLAEVEAEAGWERAGGRPHPAPPPTEGTLTPLPSDAAALGDLLRAARAAAPGAPGPWRVRPSESGRPVEAALGRVEGPDAPVPERLARAAAVLASLHGVEVRATGAAEAPDGLRLALSDLSGGGARLAVAAAAGDDAPLSPEADRAVRALLAAPPAPEAGPIPAARLVGIAGVLRVLDGEVRRVLLPRATTPAAREAAALVPREATRKALPRREFLAALEREVPGLPVHRLDALATEAAAGRLSSKAFDATAAAVLLAVLGRSWSHGGARATRGMDLGALADAEVVEVARDLLDVATVRRDLEAGREVGAAEVTRLERAALALLGRLAAIAAASA